MKGRCHGKAQNLQTQLKCMLLHVQGGDKSSNGLKHASCRNESWFNAQSMDSTDYRCKVNGLLLASLYSVGLYDHTYSAQIPTKKKQMARRRSK